MFPLHYQRLSLLLHDWFVVSLIAWVGAFVAEWRFPGLISQVFPLGALLAFVVVIGLAGIITHSLAHKQ